MSLLFIYIINYYLNKKIKNKKLIFFYVFELYFFKFELFYNFFFNFFSNFFLKKRKLCLKLFFKNFYIFLGIYLYIYQNFKFHIPKTLPHPSTLNPKSILVNPNDIIIFCPSLNVRVKMDSVNMKNGTTNVLFVVIFLY